MFTNRGKISASVLLSSAFILNSYQVFVIPDVISSSTVFANSVNKYGLTRDQRFGQAVLDVTIEDFNKSGFDYGDSVNVEFSNGKSLKDIPYYSGYNTKTGEPLLVGYHGEVGPKLAFNNSRSLYDELGIKEGETATVILNKKGKYLETENALRLKYSDRREDYSSDKQFANFRALYGGRLKKNLIYRSASPYDDIHKRAKYTNELSKNNNINYVINIADLPENVQIFSKKYELGDSYCASLFKNNRCICLGMSQNYRSKEYAEKLVEGLLKIINGKGKFLIHCTEGKDRTGFVCLIIEALCGATLSELEKDYMKTYENYYGISKEKTPEKYKAVKESRFDDYIDYLKSICKSGNLVEAAEIYLMFGGMSKEKVEKLRARICV